MSAYAKPRKWHQIQWYKDEDTPRERKLINKLDLLIVPYAFLAYWIKYIDQSNLSMFLFPPLALLKSRC